MSDKEDNIVAKIIKAVVGFIFVIGIVILVAWICCKLSKLVAKITGSRTAGTVFVTLLWLVAGVFWSMDMLSHTNASNAWIGPVIYFSTVILVGVEKIILNKNFDKEERTRTELNIALKANAQGGNIPDVDLGDLTSAGYPKGHP